MSAILQILLIWGVLLLALAAIAHARDVCKERERLRQYHAEREQHERNLQRLAANLAAVDGRQAARAANEPAVWRPAPFDEDFGGLVKHSMHAPGDAWDEAA